MGRLSPESGGSCGHATGRVIALLRGVAAALNELAGWQLRVPPACMLSCYDGDGTHFIVHRDNTCDSAAAASWAGGGRPKPQAGSGAYGGGLLPSGCVNARELTAIVYYNPDWFAAAAAAAAATCCTPFLPPPYG